MTASPNDFAFRAAGRTHAGYVRERNEDAWLIHDALPLYAVADGMGGHDSGDVASRTVVQCLGRLRADGAAMAGEAEARIELANRLLRDLAGERGGDMIGSTVVALMAHGERADLLWAGDSRAYRLRRGALTQLTTDHVMTLDSGRTALTRGVGAAAAVTPAHLSLETWRGDVFLLCTDGLTDCVTDAEIAMTLSEAGMGGTVDATCEALVEAALERGAADNVTVLVVMAK